MEKVFKLFDELIKNSNVEFKSLKYLDGCIRFIIRKTTNKKDIIHTTITIYDGCVTYETYVLTKQPIIWKRGTISRKMIRKFKGKYVIYSIERFDLLTLLAFHSIFNIYTIANKETIEKEIKQVMKRYKTLPLRARK